MPDMIKVRVTKGKISFAKGRESVGMDEKGAVYGIINAPRGIDSAEVIKRFTNAQLPLDSYILDYNQLPQITINRPKK